MSLCERFKVMPGRAVRLDELDPDETAGLAKKDAEDQLKDCLHDLADLQYLLYAENKRGVLVVLQAMDAGGKDGVIRHVMTGMNPQGVKVHSFKAPTPQELDHDFLWRIHKAVPPKGEVGVFNRSQYEDVLAVRVKSLVPREVWSRRYDQINEFERLLSANDIVILKFFLHITKDEQLERLKARLEDPRRHWKISADDFSERKRWDDYQRAYEEAINRCSSEWAPWYVIPANHKWFRDLAVARILVETLRSLDMKFPEPACDIRKIVVE